MLIVWAKAGDGPLAAYCLRLGMSMKHLFVAAAVAPLCFAATSTLAQTSISTVTSAPVKTSTTGNLDVATGGTIGPTVPGAAITVDSNNTVSIEGTVIVRDQPDATGVLVIGDAAGRTSGFTMAGGLLRADDSDVNKDTDGDGDLDGPFVKDPALRYGLRVTGPGNFIGDIDITGGLIAIKGNGASAAISLETPVVGNFTMSGQVGQLGTNSFGIVTSAPISGNVTIGGTVGAIGEGATAVQLGGDIGGKLLFNGTITATGFRYPTRPTLQKTTDRLDYDDLLIGGPAVKITNNVAGGVWFYQVVTTTSTTNTDQDGDGIADTNETVSSAITQSGSAPAVIIGGPGNITLGNNGTLATTNYGLILGGVVDALGVYDFTIDAQGHHQPIPANAVVIGGQGGTVNTSNGILVSGTVLSSSIFADSTALRLGSGTILPALGADGLASLKITGQISAGALGNDTSTPNLAAVQIDSGATVPSLVNTGSIKTGLNGTFGNLYAIRDASGTLANITNYGTISSVITTGSTDVSPVGKVVAMDLSANTTGVSVLQAQNPDTTITATPVISGDILFGSGNANLDIEAGGVVGSVAFGTGQNTFKIATGASVQGGLTNAGTNNLAIDVEGTLGITSATKVSLSSLTTGTDSTLLFTVDPKAGAAGGQLATDLVVNSGVTLASGMSISIGFRSKLPTTSSDPLAVTNLSLIDASGGLTNAGYNASLDGKLPFLYEGTLTNNADQLLLAVRRRSAAEAGLSGSLANAYNAFYDNFDKDVSVSNIVLGKTTQAAFNGIYNQFLPDYSGGTFNSLATGIRAIQRTQAEAPVDMQSDQPRSWLQEVGFGDSASGTTSDIGYASAGFTVAGGYEQPAGKLGTVGYSVAIVTADIRDDNRAFGSKLSASSLAGSFYWRKAAGGLLFDASGTGAFAWVESNRRVVDQDSSGAQNLIRTADGNWYGGMGAVRVGASYEAKLGKFYIRPEAHLDYLYLYESGYTETGAGQAVNLTVDGRSTSNASAEVGIALGARFGRSFHWGPEFSVAYHDTLGGTLGTTTAAFAASPSETFALNALPMDKHDLVVRAALKGSGAYANFAIEGSAQFGDLYDEYTGRLVVRFIF